MAFQMQVGWCETSGGKRRYAICRIPDDITKLEYPWIVVDRDGSIHTHTDDGRWLNNHNDTETIVEHLPECTGWDWFPAVRSKTPQVGEWWRHAHGGMLLIHGFTRQGYVIYEDKSGWPGRITISDISCDGWRHEPECTGFEWKPKQ